MEIKSVQKYIQDRNLLDSLETYLENYQHVILYVDEFILEKYTSIFDKFSNKYRIITQKEEINGDCIVGIGGGKIIDDAKLMAYEAGIDVVIIPTSCASDASCTDVCVVNQKYLLCGFPSMVIVDEEILSQAPTRLFVSGMGDALSTYFESSHYEMSHSVSYLCKACLDTILTYGKQAYEDQKNGLISEAFRKCVEAILYMSGTAYANTGGSLAHGLASGFSKYVPQVYHGELVAFFVLVQLCIENDERIHDLHEFYQSVGLPIHLNEIGLDEAEDEDFEFILSECDHAMISKMPMVVTSEDIIEAIRVVDAFE